MMPTTSKALHGSYMMGHCWWRGNLSYPGTTSGAPCWWAPSSTFTGATMMWPTVHCICHASARPPAFQSTAPHFPSSLDGIKNRKAQNGSHSPECGNRTPPSNWTQPYSRVVKPQPIRGFPAIELMMF